MGNRRIKRILFTIGIFLLLGTLARFQVPPVQAINNFYTTVQSGQATDSSGSIFANYGSSSQYAYNKPDSATIIAFYGGLMSHVADTSQESVCNLHVTVSGTDPNGAALAGAGFASLQTQVGPADQSVTPNPLLQLILSVLTSLIPKGIGTALSAVVDWKPSSGYPPPATGSDATTAWGDWSEPAGQCGTVASFNPSTQEKSILFGFNLQIGTAVHGTYKVKVQYQTQWTLCTQVLNGACYQTVVKTALLTDTLYYCYVECNNDFTLSANPSSLTVNAGSAGSTSTITIGSQASFDQTVSLTSSTSDSNLQISFSPKDNKLPSNGATTATLTISDPNVCDTGGPSVTITGSSTYGTMTSTHSITVSVAVVPGQCISITSNPSTLTMQQGSSSSPQITFTPQGTFTGSLGLSTTVTGGSGACPGVNCPIAQISPGTVTITSPGSAQATLTVTTGSSTPAGSYTVTISATAPGMTQTGIIPVIVVIPDFSMSSSPATVSMIPGNSASSTITLTSVNSFSGTVGVGTAVSPSGIFVGLNPQNVPLAASSTGTSTLTISSTSSTASGTYYIAITGISGQVVHTITVTVYVTADFGISSSPPSPAFISPGGTATSTITVTSMGLNGGVSLSASISPPSGVDCASANCPTMSFNPNPISLTPGATGTSTMTMATPPSIIPGVYGITVTGVSGTLSQVTTLSLDVRGLALSATSPAVSGTSASSAITLSGLNPPGTVNLALAPVPTGLSCGGLNPGSVSVPPSPATATLSCSSTAAATYTVTITGTSGSLTQNAVVTFTFMDFSIAASPSSGSLQPGTSGSSSISLGSLNGLSGSISLSSSQPLYGPPPALDGWGSGFCHSTSSTQCSATLTTRYAGDLIMVFASSPTTLTNGFSISDSANLYWHYRTSVQSIYGYPWQQITVGEFWAVAPAALFSDTIIMTTQDPPYCCPGHNLELIAFGVSGSDYQFDAYAANIGSTGNPGVQLSTWGPNRMVIGYAVDGSQPLTAGPGFIFIGTSGNNGAEYVSVPAPASGFVTFGNAQGEWAIVADVIQPIPGFSLSFNPQTVSLPSGGNSGSGLGITVASFVPFGVYTVYVTGAIQSVVHTVPITVNVANFGVSANPTIVTVNLGAPATSTINVNAIGTFNGVVSLTSSNSNCSISPSSITGSGSSTLSCPSTSATSFPVTVTGTSGSESHSTTVNFNIQDFTITASPTSITILAGTSGASTVTSTAVNGFSVTVTLSAVALPSSGLNCGFSPPSVTVSGTGTSTLYCSGAIGTYTVTITGTNANLNHPIQVTYTIRDFTFSITPTFVRIPDGRSSTLTVQATSLGGYSGTLSLSWTSSACSTWTFGKPSLTLSSGGTDSTSLTLTMGPTCYANQYPTSVTGYDSVFGVARYAALTVNASDFSIYPQIGTSVGIGGQYTLKYNVTYYLNNNYPGSILSQTSSFSANNCCLSTSVPTIFSITKPDVNSAPGLITNVNVQKQSFFYPWNGQGFYAQGRDWVFFIYQGTCSGTTTNCLYYATSTNGASWTSYNTGFVTGSTPSIVTNGTDVFYVRYDGTDTQSGKALKLG